ncbi:hypothetical protein PG995_010868 [Apiospora arundinis]
MGVEKPVIIAGAGIAGLSLARLLQDNGIPMIIFEKSVSDRSQGHGITARDWAFGPLLREVGNGCSKEDFQNAVAVDRGIGGRGFADLSFRNNGTGEMLFNPEAHAEGHNSGLFRANRSFLRDWLAEGLDVKYEHEVKSVEGGPGLVRVSLQSGIQYEGSMLVGADGVHSMVRNLVLPHIQPDILPVVLFHGKAHMSRAEYDSFVRTSLGSSNVAAGVGDNFNTFLTVASAGKDEVHLDWSYSRARQGDGDPLWMPDRAEVIKVPQHLLKELRSRDLAPPFSTLVNADAVKRDRVYNWRARTVTVPPADLDTAARRGVVLVGDAAHAMPIFGGEGGNHALLDGVELFRHVCDAWDAQNGVLGASDVDALIQAFNKDAGPRGREAVQRCTRNFSRFHQPIDGWKKVAVMANRKAGAGA